jgi:REP element-mobilizing transposase RayT
MPRTPRVEYENAVYHVMARGNRREAIVLDDGDRELFRETFAEACGRTGWEVFAWVLMDNHYHAVFRTPEPNLVAGMQWFQNAYTRRLNARHRFWGHLFGGRYKAIPVEDEATSPRGSVVWRDYARTVIDYVHLNPGRAGLVDGGKKSLLDYPWSSVAAGYALPPSKRPGWLAAEFVLDLYGERDNTAGRRRFVERLDGPAQKPQLPEPERGPVQGPRREAGPRDLGGGHGALRDDRRRTAAGPPRGLAAPFGGVGAGKGNQRAPCVDRGETEPQVGREREPADLPLSF